MMFHNITFLYQKPYSDIFLLMLIYEFNLYKSALYPFTEY